MPTIAIAIVGAGPGLGLSIAKTFGRHGFEVARVSRNNDNLEALVARLAEFHVNSAAFPADVTDQTGLTDALEKPVAQFGGIDVLEYSPYSGLTPLRPEDMNVGHLQPEIDHHLYGAVTAARTVLPPMQKAGAGTLLFTTGGGAITPYPMLSALNAAQAATRNWALHLHNVLQQLEPSQLQSSSQTKFSAV
jgi:NADP-dependent 3-hydroxy acid dehydrogenase YdfG